MARDANLILIIRFPWWARFYIWWGLALLWLGFPYDTERAARKIVAHSLVPG